MLEIIKYGGPVMYPLVVCSIIVLTVIIERTFFWIKVNKHRNQSLVDQVLDLCEKNDWESVKEKTKGSKDYVIKVIITGILHRDFSASKAMESAASDQIKNMSRYMSVIDTMITVAPLLGIFGTVIGIINSFDALGTQGLEHPQAVTAGIAQALLTTAAGLGIAIFSVFPYNFFNSQIQKAGLDIEKYGTSLEIVLKECK